MPTRTANKGARTKPPMTRQIVMPMSVMKPCLLSSSQPSSSMVSGLARNVLETKPPNVADDHAATNSTKNRMPSMTRADDEMGASGFMKGLSEQSQNSVSYPGDPGTQLYAEARKWMA